MTHISALERAVKNMKALVKVIISTIAAETLNFILDELFGD